jgi:HEAT repeat protein/DNA polymerase III delta prime subunit
MVAADFSDYLQFVLTDPRHCGNNSFYTATDALLNLEAEVVQKDETQVKGEERTPKQIERLPVLEMLRKYGLGGEREHLLLAGKPGSGKSTTLRRLCVEMAEIALGDNLQPIPVFVQLKGDKQIFKLIQAEFRRAKLKVTDEQIDDWLLEDKLVLLLDGVNEIPSEELRRELQDFRENNLSTPTIFTTRDLTMGGSLGIDKSLEMRPLTDSQMREFVHKYLPEHGDKLLGQLRDRLREIAETPLLLKMLCEVFEPQTGRIPQNKAELFELFDRKYQRHKEGVAISADFRRFQSEILQYLAFTMLQGDAEKPTEAWLTLSRSRAEGIIEAWLKHRGETDPASKAKEWLEDLVEHHLLQVAADPQQIEFHHQLFQEYYAARHLRSMLQDMHPDVVDDDRLKHLYLNYLKWTEPLGLLLGLLDDEAQALRLVELGLEVDWFLGARLAGKVKQEFQKQTVGLVDRLIEDNELNKMVRVILWQKTRSNAVLRNILILLRDSNATVRCSVVKAIVELGGKSIVTHLLPLLKDSDYNVRSRVFDAIAELGNEGIVTHLLPLLQNIEFNMQWDVVDAITELDDWSIVTHLLPLLKDSKDPSLFFRSQMVEAIARLGSKDIVTHLLPLLKDSDYNVQYSVVEAIIKLGDKSIVTHLLPLLQHDVANIRWRVVEAIIELGDKDILPHLLPLLQHDESYIRWSVLKTIVQLGDKNIITQLLPLLQKAESDVRSIVVETIVELGDESIVPHLLPLLQNDKSNVRDRAIEAIIKLLHKVDKSIVPHLLPLLQNSQSEIRWSVLQVIARLGDKSIVTQLLPLLEKAESDVRSRVVDVVIELGDKSVVPHLLPLLQNSESNLQNSVVEMIAELGDKSIVPQLLHLLQNAECYKRSRVVDVVIELGDKSIVPHLLPLLQESFSYVRSRVVDAVIELGDKSIVPHLLPLLQDSEFYRFSNVVEAIGRLGNEGFVPHLLPLLKGSETHEVLDAIARLGGEKAVVALTHVVQVRGAEMRQVAIIGLGEMTNWGKVSLLTQSLAINALLDSLESKYEFVRSAAVQSLTKIGNYKILPHLCQKLTASSNDAIIEIILAIQARCGFYNYDIFCSPPHSLQSLTTGSTFYHTENHFPNATEAKIFEQVSSYHETSPPPQNSSS